VFFVFCFRVTCGGGESVESGNRKEEEKKEKMRKIDLLSYGDKKQHHEEIREKLFLLSLAKNALFIFSSFYSYLDYLTTFYGDDGGASSCS
jgi:hypothetical protein